MQNLLDIEGLGEVANIESGSFLPTLLGSALDPDAGQIYNVQKGRYTRIGNRVFFDVEIDMQVIGSASGGSPINIGGWPFPIAAGSVGTATVGVLANVNMPLAGASVIAKIDAATQTMRIMILSSVLGHGSITVINFQNGDIKFSGMYQTDEGTEIPAGFAASQTLDFALNTAVPGGLPDDVLTVFRPGSPEPAFPENLAGDTATEILAGKLIRTDAGLYVHSIRANNIKESQNFSSGGGKWSRRGAPVIQDRNQLAPDGTMTASTLSIGGAGVLDLFQQVNGFPAATQFEPSFFIKRATTTGILKVARTSSADGQTGQWDIDMALLPDAWVRLTALHPAVTVVEVFRSDVSAFTFVGMFFNTPDGIIRTFDLWGVQIEAKGGVSPYLLTDGDFSTSILFSEITQPISQMGFGVGQGTIVIDAVMPLTTVLDDAFVFSISDNSITNSLTLGRKAGVWEVEHTIAGTSSTQVITGISDGFKHKIAFGWQTDGNLNVSIDGGTVQTFATQDGQNFIPQIDFNLGSHPDGQFNLESTIQSLTSYPDYSDALLKVRST